jgi:hypothetical protein
MKTEKFAAGMAAAVLALGLSACGSSEFHTRYAEKCAGSPQGKRVDCDCAASLLESELDDKEKRAMLALISSVDGSGNLEEAKARKALEDAGLTPEDADNANVKTMKLTPTINQKCKR